MRESPVSIEDLRYRLHRGDLSGQTLVRNTTRGEWVTAVSVAALQDSSEPRSPAKPVQGGVDVHPWIRFGARYVDISLFSTGGGIFLAVVYPKLLDNSSEPQIGSLLGMGFLFAWIFVEAVLLSSWGTTPVKSLLKISVRTQDGDTPTFFNALTRSVLVWGRGLGLGFPIVSMITQLVAYRTLKVSDIATWDRDSGCRVRHDRIGSLRVLVMLGWFAVFIWPGCQNRQSDAGGDRFSFVRGADAI